jgi:hypothetical protein
MPALADTRKEKFCQEVASGTAMARAYVLAGFAVGDKNGLANPGNASRLAKRDECRTRIEELRKGLVVYRQVTTRVREQYAGSNLDDKELARRFALAAQMQLMELATSSGDVRTAQHALEFFSVLAGLTNQPPRNPVGRPRSVKATGADPEGPKGNSDGRASQRPVDTGDEDEISTVHLLTQELDGAAGDEPEAEADAS